MALAVLLTDCAVWCRLAATLRRVQQLLPLLQRMLSQDPPVQSQCGLEAAAGGIKSVL